MKEIQLTKGYVALVDEEDFERVNLFKWYYGQGYALRKPSRNSGLRYKIASKPQSPYRQMHRLLLETLQEVDHINGNCLDNRKENLRIVTRQQNSFNRVGRKGKELKGVCWHKQRKKWRAYLVFNGKQLHLGLLDKPEHAAVKYNEAAEKLFGKFARLNVR